MADGSSPWPGTSSPLCHSSSWRTGGRRGGMKQLLLVWRPQRGCGQLFVVVGMDGGQDGGVQVLLLVAAGIEVGRRRGGKLLLLVASD